jgi:hypothetical protein
MRTPDYNEIKEIFQRKGYRFFDLGKHNLNLFGIRAYDSQSNKFDDLVGVAFRDSEFQKQVWCFKATTDAGKHWLLNPTNKDGTAIIVPNQYSGVYKVGIHGRSGSNPYKALEQVKPMRYVRDNNKDAILDFELYKDPILLKEHGFWAILKTNLHRASKWKILQVVERYSAGCQVLQSAKDFDKLIALCETAINYGYKNSFSYTLLEEEDI